MYVSTQYIVYGYKSWNNLTNKPLCFLIRDIKCLLSSLNISCSLTLHVICLEVSYHYTISKLNMCLMTTQDIVGTRLYVSQMS